MCHIGTCKWTEGNPGKADGAACLCQGLAGLLLGLLEDLGDLLQPGCEPFIALGDVPRQSLLGSAARPGEWRLRWLAGLQAFVAPLPGGTCGQPGCH